MISRSLFAVLGDVCEHFTLIFDALDGTQSSALAKKMLEDDILILGLHFGTLDEFGQLTELTLLAECIAHIRTYDSGVDQVNMIDYWTDIVMGELQSAHFTSPAYQLSTKDIVARMKTWQLTQDMLASARITNEQAALFRQSYIELADMFFMRDGNVTSEEMQAMNDFARAMQA